MRCICSLFQIVASEKILNSQESSGLDYQVLASVNQNDVSNPQCNHNAETARESHQSSMLVPEKVSLLLIFFSWISEHCRMKCINLCILFVFLMLRLLIDQKRLPFMDIQKFTEKLQAQAL
jgi:hypothetical protein